MKYFITAIELETGLNSVKYKRPKWYTDKKLEKKEKNHSNTTPADTFVDLVTETDVEDEINELQANNSVEMTLEQYNEWVNTKKLILEAQESLLTQEEIE